MLFFPPNRTPYPDAFPTLPPPHPATQQFTTSAITTTTTTTKTNALSPSWAGIYTHTHTHQRSQHTNNNPQVDFPKLLRKVDDGFRTFRRPSVCMFGSSDPFVDAASVFEFLESKRTNSE